MKSLHTKYYLFILLSAILLSACGTYKLAQKPLLNKNKVVIHGEKHELKMEEIKALITQEPNKKLLGLWRLKLYAYQAPDRGKTSNFKNWMRRSFGEAPVFHSPQTLNKTKSQIEIFLNKSGYFNSRVWLEAKFKKRTFNQYYHLQVSEPYKIRNFNYQISDSTILAKVKEIEEDKLIHSGDIYNAFIMDDERDRITEHLKNNGYFNFSKEYIYFEVDSTLNSKQTDVNLVVKKIERIDLTSSSKITEEDHKQYNIKRVFVNPDFDILNPTPEKLDTLLVNVHRDTSQREDQTYYFLHKEEPRIKPKAITQAILIRPDEKFSLENVKTTYRRLADLKNFKYTNISFQDISDSTSLGGKGLLDCRINLSRAKTHSYSVEAEGTNSGGNLGIGANLIYGNKNIFKGAEILEVRLSTSMEAQQLNSGIETAGNQFLFFNTIEAGIDVSLRLPKFLIPINAETFPQNFKPHTTLNVGFNYQQRPNYKRYITNMSFGYEWSQNKQTRHIFNPIELSTIKVYPTDSFQETLDEETNERIKNQYTDHLIAGLKYSFIYNSQEVNKLRDFVYLRANFESSGFLIKGIQTLAKASETNKYNTLFNIRYAQYVRADIDFRFYKIFSSNTRLVFRNMFGIGFPYGNSQDLPFEKGFFAGGANGMRGWNIRSLGPGSSIPDDIIIDRIGDLRIEFNLEYRFPIYRFLRGALFVDAGNVWRLNNDAIEGGEFKLNNFLKEIAMDAGFGFRFDFRFFVFRIDGALRMRDPAQDDGERWVLNSIKLNKIVWNFGIGYPF